VALGKSACATSRRQTTCEKVGLGSKTRSSQTRLLGPPR